jgi:hypothetical protein
MLKFLIFPLEHRHMKKLQRGEWANLILLLALIIGTFMRFNPTLLAGFPIRHFAGVGSAL